jgi:tetratricopeptide (TPR) repeat protein
MLADYYITSGEIQKGISEYASLVQEHPDDVKLRKNYAELLILTNRLDDAEKVNNEILKGNAKDVEGLIHKGQILLRRGRASEAAPVFEGALSIESDNAVARYNLGEAYRQLGNTERAEREWRETIRIRPGMSAAHEALAASALRKGDVQGVLESGESLIRTMPASATGFMLRGMARAAQKDYTAAEPDLKKALELAPESPMTHSKLAYLRAAQRRWPEAEQEFEQALARDPNFVEALRGLMVVYGGRSQASRSLSRVLAQAGKAPQNSEIQVMLGGLYMRAKQNEESEAAFGRAIEINPHNLDAYFLLAEVQKDQGARDRALATYERALKAAPSSPRTHVMLGALESDRGNWQRAEKLYRRALELDPDYSLAANNLAYLLLEHGGNVDYALTLAQDARRKIPEASFTAGTLAWAYYKKGNYGLATDLLEEAVKKAPRNSTYQFHLGLTYQKAGNSTKAKSHLNRALKLDPESPHAEEIRAALQELE